MKVESKHIKDFLDKFSKIVNGAELEFGEKGIKHVGTDDGTRILSKVILGKTALINYEPSENGIYLDNDRLDLLSKVCKEIDEEINLEITNEKISLTGKFKKCNMLLSEKPNNFKKPPEKDWDSIFTSSVDIPDKLNTELKGFIDSLKVEKITFEAKNGTLIAKLINQTNGIDAKITMGDYKEDIEVTFNADLLRNILGLLDTGFSLSLATDKPLRIKGNNPLIKTEYILAPIIEEKEEEKPKEKPEEEVATEKERENAKKILKGDKEARESKEEE